MNFSRATILVAMLAFSLILPTSIHLQETETVMDLKQKYKVAMEIAVDDAMSGIVESDRVEDIVLNKDRLLEQFYHSLFINLGCPNDTALQDAIKTYIPIVLLVDRDGYYISYSTTVKDSDGHDVIGKNWSEKLPFAYAEETGRVFNFTIGDEVTVYDPYTNMVNEGMYQDLARMPMYSIDNPAYGMHRSGLLCGGRFEEIRRNTIINALTDSMSYYINVHNTIAQQFGISYTFSLPYIEESDWARTIDDISMFALFQGYPYVSSDPQLGRFNLYTIGGARIYKKKVYYIMAENGISYYHRESCEKIRMAPQSVLALPYEDTRVCARMGAYPCQNCHP